MKIRKVISGGQTGVDQAALRVAKRCNIPTGGWMPNCFRTQEGPRPDLAVMYGMYEAPLTDYGERTHFNVRDSDVTLRIASDFMSPGERLTLKAIKSLRRMKIDVTVIMKPHPMVTHPPELILDIFNLLEDRRGILNVAGNSEKTSPGIGQVAEDYLFRVFTLLDQHGFIQRG